MRQSRIFVGMVLILIFAEVLGLYGYVCRWRLIYDHILTRQTHRRPYSQHPSKWLSRDKQSLIVRLHGVEILGRACNTMEFGVGTGQAKQTTRAARPSKVGVAVRWEMKAFWNVIYLHSGSRAI